MENKNKIELISSYEALCDDFSEHGRTLETLIEIMCKIDYVLAIDMWEQLLRKNQKILVSRYKYQGGSIYLNNEEYVLTNGILSKFMDVSEDVIDTIMKNKYIIQCLFELSGCIHRNTIQVVSHLIDRRRSAEADELLELINKNANKGTSMFTVLRELYVKNEQSSAITTIMTKWIEKVDCIKEKAALRVLLIKAMEENSVNVVLKCGEDDIKMNISRKPDTITGANKNAKIDESKKPLLPRVVYDILKRVGADVTNPNLEISFTQENGKTVTARLGDYKLDPKWD